MCSAVRYHSKTPHQVQLRLQENKHLLLGEVAGGAHYHYGKRMREVAAVVLITRHLLRRYTATLDTRQDTSNGGEDKKGGVPCGVGESHLYYILTPGTANSTKK